MSLQDKTREVVIRCDDHAECVVFTRYKWDDGANWYEINVEDSYCGGRGYAGVLGRFKRAWKAFWDRPIYYSGVCVGDGARVKQFLHGCLALVEENANDAQRN